MKRALAFFVALLVVAGGIVAVVVTKSHKDKVTLPSREVDTFLHAWSRNDAADMATLLDRPPVDLATTASSLTKAIPGSTATYTRTGLTGTDVAATATYHATVAAKGLTPIQWDGSMALTHTKETGWRITWNPSVLYPGLLAGQHFAASHVWPARASILAADGSVLAGHIAQVNIGIEPDHIRNPADLAAAKAQLLALLHVDPAKVDAAYHAPGKPFYFQYVTTVPKDAAYPALHEALVNTNGIVFQPANGVTASDHILELQVLGSVGEITADGLKELGAPYAHGDEVGQSGIQKTYEKRLAGTPRTDVSIVNAAGTTVKVLERIPGIAPKPVKLTIDPKTQAAAEAALAGVTKNAALVAIEPSTGAIRAIVSKPDDGFVRALSGTYPPGSTFKVVTSAALIAAGDTAATPAPCPQVATVGGREFHNFEGEASATLDLQQAFAKSCNNSFIGLASQLPADALSKAAASFGFNQHWLLGVDSAASSYPTPGDKADLAASAIGQGRVLASPVQMATVAATVANGRWLAPTLITDPARPKGPVVAPLAPNVDATLKSFMATVVQPGGTAAGAGLPADSFGKTGTAEFGSGNPPATHAWFIGFRGNLAYSVIVEDGGVGGAVAAPLAASFLTTLSH